MPMLPRIAGGKRRYGTAPPGLRPCTFDPGPPTEPRDRLRYDRDVPTLSRADVEHVAHLARLGLSDDELTRLEGQLNHILDQYAILARLDTEHIPPTAQTIELGNILRDDVAGPSLPPEVAVANAAAHAGGFIVVPRIIADAGDAADAANAANGADAADSADAVDDAAGIEP